MAIGDVTVSVANGDGSGADFICGPCQVACCLYPWPDLASSPYDATDLPDKLLVGIIDEFGDFRIDLGSPTELIRTTVPWIGTFFGRDWSDISGYVFASEPDMVGVITLIVPTAVDDPVQPARWLVCFIRVNEDDTVSLIGIEGFQHCLVSLINDTDLFWRTDDEFDDTYTVNGTDTITRQSHDPTEPLSCIWLGDGWRLKYNSATFKWELNGIPKDDTQSSPVGTYAGDSIT